MFEVIETAFAIEPIFFWGLTFLLAFNAAILALLVGSFK